MTRHEAVHGDTSFNSTTTDPRWILNLTAPRLLVRVCILIFLLTTGCSRRPRPPVPAETQPGPATSEAPVQPADRPAAAVPQLEVTVDPPVIQTGDSALLTWETENADHVVISHNVGMVEPSGRIRFFPEETTTYEVTARGEGGSVTKTVTVEVGRDQPAPIMEEDLRNLPLQEQFSYFVKPVFFGYDSAQLSEEGRLTLDGNIQWLNRPQNRRVRFIIEGHCDERGTEEYNLALGDRRAQAVKDYLAEHGVDPSRIITVSLGEERPFDARPIQEAWALNRRAHFVLLEGQQVSN